MRATRNDVAVTLSCPVCGLVLDPAIHVDSFLTDTLNVVDAVDIISSHILQPKSFN